MTYNFETDHDGVRVVHDWVYFPFWNRSAAMIVTQMAIAYAQTMGHVFVYERETKKEVVLVG